MKLETSLKTINLLMVSKKARESAGVKDSKNIKLRTWIAQIAEIFIIGLMVYSTVSVLI